MWNLTPIEANPRIKGNQISEKWPDRPTEGKRQHHMLNVNMLASAPRASLYSNSVDYRTIHHFQNKTTTKGGHVVFLSLSRLVLGVNVPSSLSPNVPGCVWTQLCNRRAEPPPPSDKNLSKR